MTGALVVRGDARRLPLPDASVDLIVTSPPYFALRSYMDGGEHYAGQIGSEATPAEWLDALWGCTREWMRVLKPTGSLWVNLGDKYAGTDGRNGGAATSAVYGGQRRNAAARAPYRAAAGAPSKSLIGLPWRYAIGCIDDLGLILRAEVVWSKPNGLPESVTDRVRRSHETWFHFTLQPRYYTALDEVREPYATADRPGSRSSYAPGQTSGTTLDGHVGKSDAGLPLHPLGKVPGSVWSVPSEPLKVPADLGVDHFAAFPTEWPRRIILGWSPPGICVACGEGRRPVVSVAYDTRGRTTNGPKNDARRPEGALSLAAGIRSVRSTSITGYVCACPEPTAPTRPAVVLDPAGGSGTVALVARALGRAGVSVDLSYDYSRLARWRACGDVALSKLVEKWLARGLRLNPMENEEGLVMGLVRSTTVVCDQDQKTLDVPATAIRDVKAKAREAGWTVTGRGESLSFQCPDHDPKCPYCQQDMDPETAHQAEKRAEEQREARKQRAAENAREQVEGQSAIPTSPATAS